MATIHVNTEVMRRLGQFFIELTHQIENVKTQIHNGIAQLEQDWTGASRAHYEDLFSQWNSHAQQLIELGEQIGLHLKHTADAFDQADHTS